MNAIRIAAHRGDVLSKRLIRAVVVVHFGRDHIDFDIHLHRVACLVFFDSRRGNEDGIDMASTLGADFAHGQREGGGVVGLSAEVCAIGTNNEALAAARPVGNFRAREADPPRCGAGECVVVQSEFSGL